VSKLHYYFDESGEKGFLREGFAMSDLGLIAGIALPERVVPQFERGIGGILGKCTNMNEISKVHAVELFKEGANQDVKEEVLSFLCAAEEWLLIYEAVYPLGLYRYEQALLDSIAERAPRGPGVKVSGNKAKIRVYTVLLEGVIIKLDEVCAKEQSPELLMISDRLDARIHKEALSALGYLKEAIHVKKKSGFDAVTREVVHGNVTSEIAGLDIAVKYVKEIVTEDAVSVMTVAADIVANTLYRHLIRAVEASPGVPLHSDSVMAGFPLKGKAQFVGDYVVDRMYSPIVPPAS
jgi:hypothetical protein